MRVLLQHNACFPGRHGLVLLLLLLLLLFPSWAGELLLGHLSLSLSLSPLLPGCESPRSFQDPSHFLCSMAFFLRFPLNFCLCVALIVFPAAFLLPPRRTALPFSGPSVPSASLPRAACPLPECALCCLQPVSNPVSLCLYFCPSPTFLHCLVLSLTQPFGGAGLAGSVSPLPPCPLSLLLSAYELRFCLFFVVVSLSLASPRPHSRPEAACESLSLLAGTKLSAFSAAPAHSAQSRGSRGSRGSRNGGSSAELLTLPPSPRTLTAGPAGLPSCSLTPRAEAHTARSCQPVRPPAS